MKFSLHFGNNTFPDFAGAARLARLTEQAGFDSILAIDHAPLQLPHQLPARAEGGGNDQDVLATRRGQPGQDGRERALTFARRDSQTTEAVLRLQRIVALDGQPGREHGRRRRGG